MPPATTCPEAGLRGCGSNAGQRSPWASHTGCGVRGLASPTRSRAEGGAMTLSGGCQCGAVRYVVTAEPLALYVCHCRECQKQSASAFGVSLVVPGTAFRLTAGEPRTWSRQTDSGRTLDC